jgi:PAS domain S-box-containing protein
VETTELNSFANILRDEKSVIMKNWWDFNRSQFVGAFNKNQVEIKNQIEFLFDSLVQALQVSNRTRVEKINKEIKNIEELKSFNFHLYTLDQIVYEYHIFRKILADFIISHQTSKSALSDLLITNALIDKAVDKSILEFTNLDNKISELLHSQRLTVKAPSEFMWICDREQRYLYVNYALCKYWNMPQAELIGTTIVDSLNDGSLTERVNSEIEKVFKGEVVIGDINYTKTSGRPGFYQYNLSPIFNKSGEVEAVAGFIINYTKSQRVEIKLIEEQRKLNELTSELKLALNERDKSLRTLYHVNRVGQNLTSKLNFEDISQSLSDIATDLLEASYCAFFYFNKEENGKKQLLHSVSGIKDGGISCFKNFAPSEIFMNVFENIGTILSQDVTQDSRFQDRNAFAVLPFVHLPIKSYLSVPVFSRSGEVLGNLFLAHEMNGYFSKQDEEIIQGLAVQAGIALDNAKLYQNLQDSIKARDAFLSIASHELKTPLTSLTLQSQMRKRQLLKGNIDAFSDEKLKNMFEADVNQLGRLNHLIDDMLDISRLRMGKLALKKEKINLTTLANEVIEKFRPQLEEISVEISFESNGDIWIDVDPYRLEQVFTNLLSNAMKYGMGKPLLIKVFSNENIKKAYFCISDKGIGINIEDQKRIFSRFERAVSPNDVSGLGLGLFISKDIVEAHGGEILLESEVGVGSTFSVELPFS